MRNRQENKKTICKALKWAVLSIGVLALPLLTAAQDFKVFDRDVQIHGFASQGFVYTNDNNWLTMNSSDGSGAMTDFGVNASMAVTDKFRIGAQFYDGNVGHLEQWHPTLDWATASYRFTPWFGIRGGKVKTVMGLYTDTQDLDFLHTFALLPQGIYPIDMRESTIAHEGGDLYGDIGLKSAGTLSYVAYAGQRNDSHYGGYPYLLGPFVNFKSYGGLQYGGDLRWQTPLKGLLVGFSRMNEDISGNGTTIIQGPLYGTPWLEHSVADWRNQTYGQYTIGKFEIESEWLRYWRNQYVGIYHSAVATDVRSEYVAGSYRFTKWFQVGSYFSHYYMLEPSVFGQASTANATINDKVITGRFDINRYIIVKIEGHFIAGDGYPKGTIGLYPDGFYTENNPQGLQPNTNALVLKTSFRF